MKDVELEDIRRTLASCQYTMEKFETKCEGETQLKNDTVYKLMQTKVLIDKLLTAIEGRK